MALPIIQDVGTLKKTGLKYLPSGKAVFKFQVECSEKISADKWENLYLSGELWEKQAEFANEWFKDGSVVLFSGKLVTKSYDRQDGTKAYENKLLYPTLSFIPKDKSDNQSQNNMQNPPSDGGEYINQSGIRKSNLPEISIDEDSIPFAPLGLQYPYILHAM